MNLKQFIVLFLGVERINQKFKESADELNIDSNVNERRKRL
jgi:hypothetical protein